MTRPPQADATDVQQPAPAPAPLRRAWHVVSPLPHLVLASWFAWSLIDEDAIPPAFAVASGVAAVLVIVDVGIQQIRGRADKDSPE